MMFLYFWSLGQAGLMQPVSTLHVHSSLMLNLSSADMSWKPALPVASGLFGSSLSGSDGAGWVHCNACHPLPWCSSYPVPSTPEGYLIACVTSAIRSAPAGRAGRRAVLAGRVQRERESGERGRRRKELCVPQSSACALLHVVSAEHLSCCFNTDQNDRRNITKKKLIALLVTYSLQSVSAGSGGHCVL